MDFTVRYAEVQPVQITHRLIRNPNYGGTGTIVPGCCVIPVVENKIKPEFFAALRKNVARDGFRNPILVYNTPEGLLLSFGGSRLRVAKELDILVPAIVVDYSGEYSGFPEVTPDNYREFFKDPPVLFEFTSYGVDTHYSLERLRRDAYDPAGMAWTEGLDDVAFLKKEFPWLSE